MIDAKHANIGATVSLLLNIHKLTGPDEDLPNMLCDLFTQESEECDYQVKGSLCTYKGDTPVKCMIGNCPLGAAIDKMAHEGGFPTVTDHALTLDDEKLARMGLGKKPSYLDKIKKIFRRDK